MRFKTCLFLKYTFTSRDQCSELFSVKFWIKILRRTAESSENKSILNNKKFHSVSLFDLFAL